MSENERKNRSTWWQTHWRTTLQQRRVRLQTRSHKNQNYQTDRKIIRLRETISSESELEHLQRQRVTVIIPVLVLVVNGPEDHHRSVNQRGSVGQFLNIWQKALELLQVLQIKDRQEETEPVSGHQDWNKTQETLEQLNNHPDGKLFSAAEWHFILLPNYFIVRFKSKTTQTLQGQDVLQYHKHMKTRKNHNECLWYWVDDDMKQRFRRHRWKSVHRYLHYGSVPKQWAAFKRN